MLSYVIVSFGALMVQTAKSETRQARLLYCGRIIFVLHWLRVCQYMSSMYWKYGYKFSEIDVPEYHLSTHLQRQVSTCLHVNAKFSAADTYTVTEQWRQYEIRRLNTDIRCLTLLRWLYSYISKLSDGSGKRTVSCQRNQLTYNYNATDLIKALLGNDSVNRFQRETIETMSQWTNVIALY
jgi:hypothetical protein